ncbi:ATP-binding protein [Novosphingobium terrae]|uniref:ATP-binding protein n=1 Tax=Novosphingobium terrae TaxID=2726189 RepID=UPI001981BCAB|nr:winged helix-turn-helix domain-containing protein [Novosphingobium terrae]
MNQPVARYRFGSFSLLLPHLTLSRDGEPVKLGGRALNLLAALAEAGGGLVPRDDLLARVWPGQTIDESAIRVHLSALRKALAQDGDGGSVIVNEAGRGYRLALPVTRELEQPKDALPDQPVARRSAAPQLPIRVGAIWGRDSTIESLVEELDRQRFITIAGPGGIGKTTVALAVAAHLAQSGRSATWFVDFAPINDPASVASTLATTLGLPAVGHDPIDAISLALEGEPTLLLFDNCEHVVDAAAIMAEELLRRLPSLSLLTTSREPLRAEGEWVHRLAALDVPREQFADDVAHAMAFPAIALFVERARAANASYDLTTRNLTSVIEICRSLDGIPLAIELAAARSDLMDPAMIAEGLDDRFGLLTRGRRTALPRHQTLRAALDWSYALLAPSAQRLLDRLALFRSGFDSEAALTMASGAGLKLAAARDALSDLVAKSLVSTATNARGMHFRLLDTTRHYGLDRLEESGEDHAARGDHARYLLSHFANSATAWEGKAPRDWLAAYSGSIDDARSALAWASQRDGDPSLAVELVIASAPLWFHLSLPREFLDKAEAAIQAMEQSGSSGNHVDDARRIELLASYGHALWHTRGPVPAMEAAFARALSLAEAMGDDALVMRTLWGVWAHRILAGDYVESIALAERFVALTGIDGALANRQTGAHMCALSRHFSGDHATALKLLHEVLAGDAAPERANHANHAQVDGKIAAMSLLMRLEWLREGGDLQAAMAMARECAQDAMEIDHALSACYGLAVGCIPVAIAAGELDLARAWIAAMAVHTLRHGLDHWHTFVIGYGKALENGHAYQDNTSGMQSDMFAVATGDTGQVMWARNLAPLP